MGERERAAEEMASSSVATTVPPQTQEEAAEPVTVLTLRPTQPAERKKVVWTEDTVDNENMNKKKSKCCCIYEKPRQFDESSSESDSDECEHCFGHVEHRTKHRTKKPGQPSTSAQQTQGTSEPTTTVSLQPAPPPDKPPSPDQVNA